MRAGLACFRMVPTGRNRFRTMLGTQPRTGQPHSTVAVTTSERTRKVPADISDYAIIIAGVPLDLGVAPNGPAGRRFGYGRPGISHVTNQRLKAIFQVELSDPQAVRPFAIILPDLAWYGVPVSGSAGVELGLIECLTPMDYARRNRALAVVALDLPA